MTEVESGLYPDDNESFEGLHIMRIPSKWMTVCNR